MTYCHHVVTVNGRSHYDLESTLDESCDFVGRLLARLNGTERYSLVLGALPPGEGLDVVDMTAWPVEYIQVAGSSDAMTVEIRAGLGDEARQSVVGRSKEHKGEPAVTIPWNGYVATVYPDEVFAAEEATELFAYYLAHSSGPPQYGLRLIAV